MNKREQLNKLLCRPIHTPTKERKMPNQDSSQITRNIRFDDIENSFRKFNGHQNINKWIDHFNEQATVFNFSELEKFVYTKKLMKDNAALWLQHESEATTYTDLIDELKTEYGNKQNSAIIHEQLRNRKKQKDESTTQYLYEMISIGSQADVDIQGIITHIINGLPGHTNIKAFMYEAKTLKEIKQKLKIYEIQQKFNGIPNTNEGPNSTNKGPRCYHCDQIGHVSPSCPLKNKDKTPKMNLIYRNKSSEDETEEIE